MGNFRRLASMLCFHGEGLASEKCCKEKGSVLRRKTKEALLSFNIPCPTAPSPSKPLLHFLPPPQKNPFISHFPTTCLGTKTISAQFHTGCAPKPAGDMSALGAFQDHTDGISLRIQVDVSKERTVLSTVLCFGLMFQIP